MPQQNRRGKVQVSGISRSLLHSVPIVRVGQEEGFGHVGPPGPDATPRTARGKLPLRVGRDTPSEPGAVAHGPIIEESGDGHARVLGSAPIGRGNVAAVASCATSWTGARVALEGVVYPASTLTHAACEASAGALVACHVVVPRDANPMCKAAQVVVAKHGKIAGFSGVTVQPNHEATCGQQIRRPAIAALSGMASRWCRWDLEVTGVWRVGVGRAAVDGAVDFSQPVVRQITASDHENAGESKPAHQRIPPHSSGAISPPTRPQRLSQPAARQRARWHWSGVSSPEAAL